MANDKPKQTLLTSTLDFETMDDLAPSQGAQKKNEAISMKLATPGLEKKIGKEAVQPPPLAKPLPPIPKVTNPPRPKAVGRMPVKKKEAAPVLQDKFTIYAVVVVLLGFFIVFSAMYFNNMKTHNTAGLSYIVLPESIVSVDGTVARVQATIQVGEDDKEWLQENKAVLSGSFDRALSTLDLEELRNSEGISAAQTELTGLLNRDLRTDKVEAVLLTELLVQDQRK